MDIDLNNNPEESLGRVELRDGAQGVKELTDAWFGVGEIFPDAPRKRLHVVIEAPDSGKFRHLLSPLCP